jgi:hypothetical protein
MNSAWTVLELKNEHRNWNAMMKAKFLLLSAIIFFLLGWNTKDGLLFFFFAIHLFTLTIAVFLSKFDKKLHTTLTLKTAPESDRSKS